VGSNNGTLVGGVTFATYGHPGQAFKFDGSTGYVSIGNPASLQSHGAAFSISAWVWFQNLVGPKGAPTGPCQPGGCDMSIVDKMGSSDSTPNTDGWRLVKRADNHFWFCFGVGSNGCGSSSPTTERSTTVAQAHTWYHVVGVLRPASGLSLYVDGTLEATASGAGRVNTDTAPMLFGDTSATGAQSPLLYGRLDQVRYYDRAISPATVRALATQPPPQG
jgi:hypothetical protein